MFACWHTSLQALQSEWLKPGESNRVYLFQTRFLCWVYLWAVLIIKFQLEGISVFFLSVHWDWIWAREKQIACSPWTKIRVTRDLFFLRSDSIPMIPRDLFFQRSDSIPMNPPPQKKKKNHSIYLQCFQPRPFLKFPEKEKGYKFNFPQWRILNIIWCIDHCACDLAICRTTCWLRFILDWLEKFSHGSTKEI